MGIPLAKRKQPKEPLEKGDKIELPKIDINKLNLKRPKDTEQEERRPDPNKPVSAGFINGEGSTAKLVEYTFNASDDKLREVTIISREQGKLLPQLDIVNSMLHYVIEIAQFRQSPVIYDKLYGRKRPVCPDIFSDFIHRTAQWQKSVNGVNLHEAVNIALAEVESRQPEDLMPDGSGSYNE
jgi:hypothetical protein